MGISIMRVFEYYLECDKCGVSDCVHTGDSANGNYVHNRDSAIKVCGFHRSEGNLLCEECFKKTKIAKRMEREKDKLGRNNRCSFGSKN